MSTSYTSIRGISSDNGYQELELKNSLCSIKVRIAANWITATILNYRKKREKGRRLSNQGPAELGVPGRVAFVPAFGSVTVA